MPHEFLILDGAMGTELERLGADLNDPLWSGRILRDQPELIEAVHVAHLKAGADVLLTASYQVADDPGLLHRAITVAREACEKHNRNALVAASLGPYGAFLANGSEYSGNYGVPIETLVAFHRTKLNTLMAANPDLFVFETIPSLQEARAIAQVLQEVSVTQPVWVSFSCQDERHVCSGDPFSLCIQTVANLPSVHAVGVNCTAPEWVRSLLDIAAQHTEKPLLAYPNRGATWDAQTQTWSGAETVCIADWVSDYVQAGARILGGCCQTTPKDIAQIQHALSALKR